MARISTILNFYLLYFTWSTSVTIGQKTEDPLHQLLEKYNELKEALAAKDTTKLEEKIANLEDKIENLEDKLVLLEEKFQHQKSLLITLQNNQQPPNLVNSVDQKNQELAEQSTTQRTSFRTCQQMYDFDSEMQSGWYWIDPDGHEVGDDPVYVYCDVTDGRITTSVPHDTESKIEASYCFEPGCYKREINYNGTLGQLKALAELSNECHQAFRYDCIEAPFEYNGEQYSWWEDRNGVKQYFWSGKTTTVHRCQCGIDGNCIDSSQKCNCDSILSTIKSDDGVIEATELLPVTSLNFGRAIESGQHTLGRFECTGKVTINGMPTSCADLWHVGHTLNGLYSVRENQRIKNVYCDFTKLPSDPSMQTFIGYADVKSTSVYFYVLKSNEARSGRITFKIEKLNVGNAMDISSGTFTAPRSGVYSFSFSGVARLSVTKFTGYYKVALIHNGNVVGHGRGHFDSGNTPDYQTLSFHSTLHLNAGDKVWIQNDDVRALAKLQDGGGEYYTHFTGVLLEEDLKF